MIYLMLCHLSHNHDHNSSYFPPSCILNSVLTEFCDCEMSAVKYKTNIQTIERNNYTKLPEITKNSLSE